MKKIITFVIAAVLSSTILISISHAFTGGLLDDLSGYTTEWNQWTTAATDNNRETYTQIIMPGYYVEWTLPKAANITRIAFYYENTHNRNYVRVEAYDINSKQVGVATSQEWGTSYADGYYDVDWEAVKKIRFVQLDNVSSILLYEFNAYGEYSEKPPYPQGLTATARDGEVDLSWEPVNEVEGYYVYRDDVRVNSTPITTTSYTATAQNNVQHKWQVASWDGLVESSRSDPVYTFYDSLAPAVPTGLKATPGFEHVTLTWNKNTDDEDLEGYNIYRDGVKINAQPIKANWYLDDGLTNGETYTYTITAVDESGNESAHSAPVTATPDILPPETPTGLRINPGNEQIYLIWNKNIEDDLKGYNVYRDGTKITASPVPQNYYLDEHLTNFVTYSYQITAVNVYDLESPRSEPPVIGMPEDPDVTPPETPTGLHADPGNKMVELSWDENMENDLAGYFVYRDGQRLNNSPITINHYTDTGLKNGQTYTYTVAAVDFAGNVSEQSAPVQATPELPPEAAPENLRAKATKDSITLTWDAKANTSEYLIYRDGVLIATTTATTYEDHDVELGVTYEYQVSGVVNGVESNKSNIVRVTPSQSIDFGGITLPGILPVITSAFSFAGMFAPYIVLVLALMLAAVLVGFVIWLIRRSKSLKYEQTQQHRRQSAPDTRVDQISDRLRREGREDEARRIMDRISAQMKRHEEEISRDRDQPERIRQNTMRRVFLEQRQLRDQIVREYRPPREPREQRSLTRTQRTGRRDRDGRR